MITKENIGPILALLAFVVLSLIVGVLAFVKIPAENKDLFNVGLMALIGVDATAFAYYLGSSQSSANKDKLLAEKNLPPDTDPGKAN